MPWRSNFQPDGWRYFFRSYRVLVDGQPAGTVTRGRSISIPVSPGTHTVCAKIDWTGSPELLISVQQGHECHVVVSPGNLLKLTDLFSTDKRVKIQQ